MKEHEEILNIKIDTNIDAIKSVAYIYINQTFYPANSHDSNFSSNQHSADITKCTLLKSPYFHSHASNFTKHLLPMTLEGDTLLQLQKWRDAICSAFCQYLSTNKNWPSYKKIISEHYDITEFLLLPDNNSKYITAKENYEAYYGSLRVHLVKDTTISLSEASKSHVKLVTHMHYVNEFDLIIAFFFNMSPRLGGIGPKYQDLVIPFCLGEG